jgi:hypothetical protein
MITATNLAVTRRLLGDVDEARAERAGHRRGSSGG